MDFVIVSQNNRMKFNKYSFLANLHKTLW